MEKCVAGFIKLVTSMVIFGSIGLFIRYIPLPSSVIAFVRALVGVFFLLLILAWRRTKLSFRAIKKNFLYLLLSGTAIGFNWILLFESYRYTSVAVSTLCYYMAPIIVTLLSPLVLKEKLTAKRIFCVFTAVIGIAMISGILKTGQLRPGEWKGILFGFGAAVLYATAILLNKKSQKIDAMDRTVCQLLTAALVLLPYNMLTCEIDSIRLTLPILILLGIVGIVHTGLAYYLYFGSMEHLSGQSIAIASYLDPVIAMLVSTIILKETFTGLTVIGAVAILGAAVVGELPGKGRYINDN